MWDTFSAESVHITGWTRPPCAAGSHMAHWRPSVSHAVAFVKPIASRAKHSKRCLASHALRVPLSRKLQSSFRPLLFFYQEWPLFYSHLEETCLLCEENHKRR